MKLDITAAPKSHEKLDAKGLGKQKVVMTLILISQISKGRLILMSTLYL